MDNLIYKMMVAFHNWHFYDLIRKKFITNAILLYDKLEALRGWHYCLH